MGWWGRTTTAVPARRDRLTQRTEGTQAKSQQRALWRRGSEDAAAAVSTRSMSPATRGEKDAARRPRIFCLRRRVAAESGCRSLSVKAVNVDVSRFVVFRFALEIFTLCEEVR